MNTPPAGEHARILVVARPATGRVLVASLNEAGYEVHRTPGGLGLNELVQRIRPDLAIVALEPTWFDGRSVAESLAGAKRPVPVLIIGEPKIVSTNNHVAQLPMNVDLESLLAAIAHLLARA